MDNLHALINKLHDLFNTSMQRENIKQMQRKFEQLFFEDEFRMEAYTIVWNMKIDMNGMKWIRFGVWKKRW